MNKAPKRLAEKRFLQDLEKSCTITLGRHKQINYTEMLDKLSSAQRYLRAQEVVNAALCVARGEESLHAVGLKTGLSGSSNLLNDQLWKKLNELIVLFQGPERGKLHVNISIPCYPNGYEEFEIKVEV